MEKCQRAEGELDNPSSIVKTHYGTKLYNVLSTFIIITNILVFNCIFKITFMRLSNNHTYEVVYFFHKRSSDSKCKNE
jgi:hypothetical protein